jgi:hypothetical protein
MAPPEPQAEPPAGAGLPSEGEVKKAKSKSKDKDKGKGKAAEPKDKGAFALGWLCRRAGFFVGEGWAGTVCACLGRGENALTSASVLCEGSCTTRPHAPHNTNHNPTAREKKQRRSSSTVALPELEAEAPRKSKNKSTSKSKSSSKREKTSSSSVEQQELVQEPAAASDSPEQPAERPPRSPSSKHRSGSSKRRPSSSSSSSSTVEAVATAAPEAGRPPTLPRTPSSGGGEVEAVAEALHKDLAHGVLYVVQDEDDPAGGLTLQPPDVIAREERGSSPRSRSPGATGRKLLRPFVLGDACHATLSLYPVLTGVAHHRERCALLEAVVDAGPTRRLEKAGAVNWHADCPYLVALKVCVGVSVVCVCVGVAGDWHGVACGMGELRRVVCLPVIIRIPPKAQSF